MKKIIVGKGSHFFAAAGIRAGLAFLYLLALFDYVGLPEEETEKCRETFWDEFMNGFLIHFILSGFILSWILCPSRCWYGFLSAAQILYAMYYIPVTTIIFKDYISAQDENTHEYFKIGMFGYFAHRYLSALSSFYIGFFLMRISCVSPQKQTDLYVVHVYHEKTDDDSSSSSTKKTEESESSKESNA
ncbi:hypothetical protein L5515_001779 [Caenorhabditis briggsae]|uniref:Uncharacterized protein n=1 Tax=Caenorhabditis briggsae TaxID=6238 RepID=A0AAE9J4P5_CAEBR|nr:hypothetical protein L5515_001779 [Caenorhabditis briggsae]